MAESWRTVTIPVFDFIPIVQDRSGPTLRLVILQGVSTKHGSNDTDNGRLYSRLTPNTPTIGITTIEVFRDPARTTQNRVLSGQSTEDGEYAQLVGNTGSSLSGTAVVENSSGNVADQLLIVSMAIDTDVFANALPASRMPGFSVQYGLALFHAAAMRTILGQALPAAVPHLYVNRNISAFVPLNSAYELPDITKIVNAGALRAAQADLVKAMSAQQAEHTEEFAAIATAARQRYTVDLALVTNANPAPAGATENDPNAGVMVSVGSFRRS